MAKTTAVGISFPNKIIRFIDKDRKDVSRSRYLLRILERSYAKRKIKADSLDSSFDGLTSSESSKVR